jgi:hypothetical protein
MVKDIIDPSVSAVFPRHIEVRRRPEPSLTLDGDTVNGAVADGRLLLPDRVGAATGATLARLSRAARLPETAISALGRSWPA